MKRNKHGDFIVTKIEIKDDVVQVVDDLTDSDEDEESEEEVKEEEVVETKKGKYIFHSNLNCPVVVVKQISKKEQKRMADEEFNAALVAELGEVPTAAPKEEKKVEEVVEVDEKKKAANAKKKAAQKAKKEA
jgi:hypothetical protein